MSVHHKYYVTTVPEEAENGFRMPRASMVHMTSTATRPQHLSQVLATLALSMGTLSCGLAKGYTSPALDSILDSQPHLYQSPPNNTWWAFSVTKQEVSWVASLSMLGAWFGAMIGDWIMRRGRRLALRLTSLPLAAVWLLTGIAPCVELVFTTSFIGGLCCAVITMVAQVYISEISVPGIRGCLSAMLKVVGHIGVLSSYIAGSYLNWRQSALVVAVAPTMLFVGTLFIPETPSYLVLNGRDEEAAGSLKWLRGSHVDIKQELQVIKTNVLASRAKQYELTFRNSVLTPRLYKPIAITCGLMFFQRFSGANAFIYYAVIVFRQTLGDMSPHGAMIAVGFVQLLASLLSGFLIDIVGRLPLLIASTVFMSLALAGFGSYAYYNSMSQNFTYNDPTLMGKHDWIPLLCVLVFTTALALGISPISWLLIGELFPLEYRGLGSSISTSFSYFCAFFGIKLFMDFQQLLGLHGAFWFYAAVAVCGLCFVVCCVPETKGKQLDEMNPDYAQAR
ncbi:facilitated trehalose transporter Tret1-2 homolog isoform X1 [Fopius arisanus]|uniref:Facilitated trehalose transporter Tret1-2 homolog isoform X1 n=3 Tax=Braconidae TaxID=7402 RepID=A0A9R1TB15_9HYME|nr:PREDICTED: facilitated trehalose transporter Tret1-2 homolog isoform X1 [Fopius arisanus]